MKGSAALSGLLLIVCGITVAFASAPTVKTQPGFYRLMLGDFEVTALNDGVAPYPTARVLPTATPEQIAKGLSDSALTDPVGMSYNACSLDAAPRTAAEQRARVFEMAADNGYWLAGAHVPFPGIGHVRANDGRYIWVPASYALLQ